MSFRVGCIWICCALIVVGVVACLPKRKKPLPRPFADPRKAIHSNFTRDFK